jgi:hypothetical protein
MPGFDRPSTGLLQEALFQSNANSIVSRYSNLGANNPNKGPTARSLFYEAAKRIPSKYGQFLFYSLGSYQNDFIDAYYRSESRDYNLAVSSLASKNPSAGFLVRETLNNEMASSNGILGGIQASYTGNIVGGLSAPYYWKDFLYCKYYGTIPNNYMITLRRFPTPVLDNLSVPSAITSSESYHKEGVGRPVAQAVTWYGGNTSNTLNTLLTFTTGIEWESKPQDITKTQQAFSQGFFQDGPISFLTRALGAGSNGTADGVLALIDGTANASDVRSANTNAIRAAKLRDRAKDPNGLGLLSEYIWVPVDFVKSTQIRAPGLSFTWSDLSVVFEYELSSVGEVNTKAAMLDILGNLLSIGTNYGNFLTPDIRYDSRFPPIGFPGGDSGLEMYYKDPLGWIIQYADEISGIANFSDGKGSSGDSGESTSTLESVRAKLAQLLNGGGSTSADLIKMAKDLGKELGAAGGRLFRQAVTAEFIEKFQAPISLLTGAPVGEWHLTIGNPCNPIAMIGNLVCTGVSISFSEKLGPDDFPTGIKATFTLRHGRERERGEIESIFNRGDGRLYQSSLSTSASSQSFASTADINGQILSENTPTNFNNQSVWTNDIGAQIPR